jgi:hypothetical protein
VDTQADTGKFVRALVQSEPGKDLLGVSQMVTYSDSLKTWGDLNGVPTRFTHLSDEQYEKTMPESVAKEIQEGFAFNEDFGWDGGEPGVLRPSDIGIFFSHRESWGKYSLIYSFAVKVGRTCIQYQGLDQGARLVVSHLLKA